MKRLNGFAVPRHQLFRLADGTYVVRWNDQRVQELISGNYQEYEDSYGGDSVTDHDLKQLRASGYIEHYTRDYVWLYPLPEARQIGSQGTLRGERRRYYYLAAGIGADQLDVARHMMAEQGLDEYYNVRVRDELIIVVRPDALPFETLDEAEQAQKMVQEALPTLFQSLTIAFFESRKLLHRQLMNNDDDKLDLDELIASQSDTSKIAGSLVVLVVPQDDERQVFTKLFDEMQLNVIHAASAAEALESLEDHPADLLVMDIQLPDMHGWQMLAKIKEIGSLRDLPVIVITDQSNFGTTVARVDYLVRPVSIARLRHNVWMALTQHHRSGYGE